MSDEAFVRRDRKLREQAVAKGHAAQDLAPHMDNIPEFYETEYDHLKAQYDRIKENEHARHGAAMFATGVIEGLRQAIYAIETDRREVQPSRLWPGMNSAIAAIERAITQRQAEMERT